MSALRDKSMTKIRPTPEDPAIIEVGNGSVELSRAAYWHEDGQHIFRSLEYDVIAAAEDPYDAVRMFVRNSVEYARLLSEAEDRTDADVEVANLIMGRIVRIWEEMEADRRPEPVILHRIRFRYGRRRGGHRWRVHPAALN